MQFIEDIPLEVARVPEKRTPLNIFLHAEPKFGKTTMGANADDPIMMLCGGETGYSTLLEYGMVPAVRAPHVTKTSQIEGVLSQIVGKQAACKTIVVDTASALLKLYEDEVLQNEHKGDVGKFMAYQHGPDMACIQMVQMMYGPLAEASRVSGADVLMLCHTAVGDKPNPLGQNYQQYRPDIRPRGWAAINAWADIILMGRINTEIDPKTKKVTGNDQDIHRILYASSNDAVCAGNRLGMKPIIRMTKNPSDNWRVVSEEIERCRNLKQGDSRNELIDATPGKLPRHAGGTPANRAGRE